MSWAKLDDRRHQNVKLLRAGLAADGLDARGITYSSANETDGFVDEHAVPLLTAGAPWRKLVATLEREGRWERVDGGWQIHDYLDFNPSHADLEAKREADRVRKQSGRIPSGIQAVSKHPDPTRPVKTKTLHEPASPATAGEGLNAKAKSTPRVGTKAPDPLFDAVVDACRINPDELTPDARGALNKAIRGLRLVGATPADVPRRAAAYRRQLPNAILTPLALAKHWPQLGSIPGNGNGPVRVGAIATPEQQEAARRRAMELAGYEDL